MAIVVVDRTPAPEHAGLFHPDQEYLFSPGALLTVFFLFPDRGSAHAEHNADRLQVSHPLLVSLNTNWPVSSWTCKLTCYSEADGLRLIHVDCCCCCCPQFHSMLTGVVVVFFFQQPFLLSMVACSSVLSPLAWTHGSLDSSSPLLVLLQTSHQSASGFLPFCCCALSRTPLPFSAWNSASEQLSLQFDHSPPFQSLCFTSAQAPLSWVLQGPVHHSNPPAPAPLGLTLNPCYVQQSK